MHVQFKINDVTITGKNDGVDTAIQLAQSLLTPSPQEKTQKKQEFVYERTLMVYINKDFNRIAAIKFYKDCTGVGLKDAKDAVDELIQPIINLKNQVDKLTEVNNYMRNNKSY